MLWFSANQRWEPTATKLYSSKQGQRRLTFEEQVRLVGCIRFGLPATDARLLDWKAACAFAGTKRDTRRAMEQAGKRLGANPAHWFAVGQAIPIEELHLQIWCNGWHDTTGPRDMAEAWTKAITAA